MFAELQALVVLAEVGSMDRAAKNLRLTPSALTRRIQRLEIELGAVLIDRRLKPSKLTQAGLEVVERSRAILESLTELKTSTSGSVPPSGPFRLGLSHVIAQPDISKAIIALGKRFPLLQPSISNSVSCHLLAGLRLGELDGAIVVLPTTSLLPADLEGITLTRDDMCPVQARNLAKRGSKGTDFVRRHWILNPVGCLVREEIKRRIQRLGAELSVAAELHNPGLQLALVAGNVGVGMVRKSVFRRHPLRTRLSIIGLPDFTIPIRVAFFRARHLGTREVVALELQRLLLDHFGQA